MLELQGIRRSPSLPSIPRPLWRWLVAPDRVLSMGQIELNCELMLNWNVWNRTVYVSILLYGCTTWTLTKRLEKKLDGNYTRMLRAILNKSWRQHTTRHQLYGHLPPITKTIQVRRTRHAGHCWRSWYELINVLLWTPPTYGRAKAGRPARTYIQQLCEDTGCSAEDLTEVMNDREKWRKRVRDIRASGMTRWWWLGLKNTLTASLQRGKFSPTSILDMA